MKELNSIFKTYNINKALVKSAEKLEIVILDRDSNLSFNRWINFIKALKYCFNKEVAFFSKDTALKLYGNLNDFILYEEKQDG